MLNFNFSIMLKFYYLDFKQLTKKIFLIVLLLSFIPVKSHCIVVNSGVDELRGCTPNKNYSYAIDPDILAEYPEIIIRVNFWGINKDNGESKNPLTEKKVMEALGLLNSAYADMNICFELSKFEHINNSTAYWGSTKDFSKFLRDYKDDYVKNDALNIFVPYRFTNFDNNLRGVNFGYNKLAVNMLNYNTGILPHEVGHSFRLRHTHQGFKSKRCEKVTRDPDNPEFNAKCAGDYVVDTNAVPSMYGSEGNNITDDCKYTGNAKDCDGTPYNITEDDVRNFMAYTKQSCRSRFTVGQGIRVRETIELQDFYQKMIIDSSKEE